MTEKQIKDFTLGIAQFQGTDLNELKKLIDLKIQEEYDRTENFMLHERIDDYIYIVYYFDDSYHYYCIGADAYNEYIRNEYAVKIGRKTKDLFPTYEMLMEKEISRA